MAMQILKDTFMPGSASANARAYGRSREINGNYEHSRTDYTERGKEKQTVPRTKKAEEAEKAAEVKESGRQSETQDEYISSDKSREKPTGLYRIGRDKNGNRKVFFDDPKASHTDGKEPKAGGNNQGKPAEICVGNTDKVDREIKKLKEKKQQIQSASGDKTPFGHPSVPSGARVSSGNKKEHKIHELERKLAQVEQELGQKDNDTYRKQHSVFSLTK